MSDDWLWETPDEINPPVYHCHTLVIRDELEPQVYGALALLFKPELWRQVGTMDIETATQEMQDMWTKIIGRCDNVIGQIVMHTFTNAALPDEWLPCDGSVHNRVDYPELWDVLRNPYKIDADTFMTPDLRGRVPIGRGTGGATPNINVNEMGGQWEVTLTTSQMPSHNHIQDDFAVGVSPEGGGAPIPSVIPPTIPSNTGNRGGGNPHDNFQPYTGVQYALVAKQQSE
jgi:microcystin-dependent protein